MRINWTRLAETMASMNLYGPMFLPDGSIYSVDGQLLVAPSEEPAVA